MLKLDEVNEEMSKKHEEMKNLIQEIHGIKEIRYHQKEIAEQNKAIQEQNKEANLNEMENANNWDNYRDGIAASDIVKWISPIVEIVTKRYVSDLIQKEI